MHATVYMYHKVDNQIHKRILKKRNYQFTKENNIIVYKKKKKKQHNKVLFLRWVPFVHMSG